MPMTRRRLLAYGARGMALSLAGLGFWSTRPSQIDLTLPAVAIQDLPDSFDGLTLALLTDFHASVIVGKEHIREAARLAMSQKPDIITLTGDFISGSTKFLSGDIGKFNESYLIDLLDALRGLQAPLGIFGVLGNHDFWSGAGAVTAIMEALSGALGVVWLRNTAVRLTRGGESLDILGVDDFWEASCSLDKAYRAMDNRAPKILLSHNPDINADIRPRMRVDLVLSGHTHGGQVVIPGIGMPFLPSSFGQKYREGLVHDEGRQTYVSRGIGHLLAPVRLNCPPEVAIIRMVKART